MVEAGVGPASETERRRDEMLYETKIDDHFDIRSHNGVITVTNTNRGTHRTFRIKTQKEDAKFAPGERILSLLTGPDNTSDYTQVGFIKNDGRVILWRKYRTEGYEALARVLQYTGHYRNMGFDYKYEGRCRVCNRRLTTPESIDSGIGPKCAGRQ